MSGPGDRDRRSGAAAQPDIVRVVLLLTVVRLAVNVARRFPYPFLPEIGRSLGVGLPAVQAAVGLQSAVGIGSPLLGPLADRHGRKRAMVAAVGPMAPAMFAAALWPSFGTFAAALVVCGLGKMVFDPALQAYLGDRVHYARRGLALGATELAWAGSLLLAAPVVGALLAGPGLAAVFWLVGGMLAAGWAALALLLPGDRGAPAPSPLQGAAAVRAWWNRLRGRPAALPALGYSLLVVTANEIFLINYGAWMEEAFGLSLAALGAATLTVAFAEAGGEAIVVGLADRLGKRRLALAGAAVSSLCYLAVPAVGGELAGGLALLALMFVAVEVAIVASIPLLTEIMPAARGAMMSANVGAHAGGRVLGALAGGLLAGLAGRTVAMAAAGGLGLAAFLLLWGRVPEARPDAEGPAGGSGPHERS